MLGGSTCCDSIVLVFKDLAFQGVGNPLPSGGTAVKSKFVDFRRDGSVFEIRGPATTASAFPSRPSETRPFQDRAILEGFGRDHESVRALLASCVTGYAIALTCDCCLRVSFDAAPENPNKGW